MNFTYNITEEFTNATDETLENFRVGNNLDTLDEARELIPRAIDDAYEIFKDIHEMFTEDPQNCKANLNFNKIASDDGSVVLENLVTLVQSVATMGDDLMFMTPVGWIRVIL